jgi:hypothetical protein
MRRGAWACLALGMACLCGCGEESPAPATQPTVASRTERVESGDVAASITLDRTSIRVGDPLTVEINVDAPPGVIVDFPSQKVFEERFTVVSFSSTPGVPQGEKRRWIGRYVLSTFESGTVEVPAIEVTARRGADGARVSIALPAMDVTVESVVGEDADPTAYRDIRDVVDIPAPHEPWSWERWAIVVGGAAVVGAIAALLVRRRPVSEAPPPPPHVLALEALDRLAASGLVERGAFREFYGELTDIVRTYIERRFGLMAPERTTEEFLRDAEHSAELGLEHREMLRGFLRGADMVKFALHQPRAEDATEALAEGRSFVEGSALRPSIAEGAPT